MTYADCIRLAIIKSYMFIRKFLSDIEELRNAFYAINLIV